jgi:hypothetical protein
MYIEIESVEYIDRDAPSRKTGEMFYFREQRALIFKEGSKYPEHFSLSLALSRSPEERNSVGPVSPGKYSVSEEAFRVDRFGRLSFDLQSRHLRPFQEIEQPEQKTRPLFGKTGT